MKKRNIWIWVITVLLVLGAAAAAAYVIPRLSKEEAAVFPVTMVGYTDFYSGSAESSGLVTTDKVQTLYLSESQTVTEILVYPGQSVKKGDVLYTYDTTLTDLALERKDLENRQLEMQLKTARAELTSLNKMKPIVYKPSSTSGSSGKVDYTKSPKNSSKINTVYSTNTTGRSSGSPLYFWLKNGDVVDEELIGQIFAHAEKDANKELTTVYVVFQSVRSNKTGAEFDTHYGVCFRKDYTTVTEPDPTVPKPTEPKPTEPKPTEPKPTESQTTEPAPTEPPTEAPTEAPTDPAAENETRPVSGSEPAPARIQVFNGYSMTFFAPPSAPKEDSGTVEWNDGYTAAELASMRSDKQDEIKQLEFDIKMGKAELNIMKKEAADGKVLAEFDGTVSDILEPAAALEAGEPMMKVTGGGGYYVEGAVSELALNTLRIGQNVTINSWDTGAVCTGTVVEIGAYPASDQESYGSSNTTYYPFKVFIDESADLQEGFYVSMTYQTEEQAAGTLYVQNAFLRTEGNRSYVYVRGAEGLLEKRYLECGVSTDGYMTPIYAGITEADYLAFPYGSAITEGAPTFEGTDQDLYGY